MLPFNSLMVYWSCNGTWNAKEEQKRTSTQGSLHNITLSVFRIVTVLHCRSLCAPPKTSLHFRGRCSLVLAPNALSLDFLKSRLDHLQPLQFSRPNYLCSNIYLPKKINLSYVIRGREKRMIPLGLQPKGFAPPPSVALHPTRTHPTRTHPKTLL